MKYPRIFKRSHYRDNIQVWYYSDNMGRSWQAVQLTEFTGPKELKIVN